MRPIEFRIYCEQNKEMLKVDYLHFDDEGELWLATSVDDVVPYFENQKDWHLMQYTGLKDKNGNKIFEGDIIGPSGFVAEINQPGIVKWCDRKLCFYVDSIETLIYSAGYKMYFGLDSAIKIIGNIWEDGDLINDCKNAKTD